MGGEDPLALLLIRLRGGRRARDGSLRLLCGRGAPGGALRLRLANGWSLPLLGAVWLAAACDTAGGSPSAQVVDSAGVQIVQSETPAWGPADGWQLSATPSLELDVSVPGAESEPADVVAGARLSDGTLAVADAAAGEVRFFGSDGAYRGSAARPGGEHPTFAALTSLATLPGDSVAAFDAADARVVVIAPDGAVAREVPLAWPEGVGADRADALEDGSWLVRTAWRASELPAQTGVTRAPIWFLRFSVAGELLDTVARASGPAVATVPLGEARTVVSPLLGPVTVHAVHRGRLYVGTGETMELRVHAAGGALERILRVPAADLTVSPEELEGARAERAASAGANPLAGRLLDQIERSVPPPTQRPAFGDLRIDRLGNAWIGEYPWLGPGGNPPRTSRLWTVFDPVGLMLGQVRVPDGLQLLEIGADYVLALRREPSGEQRLTLFGISR